MMSQKKGVSLFSVITLVGLMIGSVIFGVTPAYAADGSGTNAVTPTSTDVSSTGNTFTFTFTAAETMNSGGINIAMPAGFSAPQGTAGTAGYTTVSTTGTIADVIDDMDSATGWSAGSACAAGAPTADTGVKHEGAASIHCINGNESNGDVWYKNITSQNWASYTTVGFWIRTDVDIAANRLQFSYDNSANLASPIESINIPAITANTWTYVTINFGVTTRTSVVSYGFRIANNAALDNITVYADDIVLGPGSLTFPSSSINARFLQLAALGTATMTYGDGGGTSGVTVPSVFGTYTATTTSRFDDSGALTNIASHPTITVKNPTPVLTAISPTSTEVQSGTTTVTLTGSGFVASSVARWNDSDRMTSFINSTTLEITVPSSDLTTAGTSTITVFNPTPGGGTSSGQSFVVRNRVPVVTTLSPNEAFIGDATTTVTVTGQQFVSGSVANWNGSARTTAFVNSTTLDMTVTTTDLASTGTSTVTVTNPTPGGGTSTTSAAFVVKYRTPTITSNTPDPVFVNETTILTITGTNFYSNSVVAFAGTTLSSTTTGSTSITATLPAAVASTTGAFSLTVTNPTPGGGSAATTTNVHYRAPTITSNTPDPVYVNETTILTITGTNFYSNSVVAFAGTTLSSTTTGTTLITATLPAVVASSTGAFSLTVTNSTPGGGSAATTTNVHYRAPTITNIAPDPIYVNEDANITITGTNFYGVTVVRYNDTIVSSTTTGATSITATIPASLVTTTGSSTIKVTNPTPGGGEDTRNLNVHYRAPTITSNTPDPVYVNETTILTITGTNFYGASVVKFAGTTLSSTTTGSTSITATLPASVASTTGAFSLTVTNPTPGGGSAATTTNVHYRAPTLTSIDPAEANVGSGDTLITLTGTNFYAISVARFDGSNLTTTYVSPTELTATIPAAMLTTVGTSTVTVFNPTPGGGTSGGQTFIRRNPTPSVTSVDPSEAFIGSPDTIITVTGVGFVSSTVIRFDGDDLTTTLINATTATATIPAAMLTTAGTSTITAFNPAPGGGLSTTSVTFLRKNQTPTITSLVPDTAEEGSATTSLTIDGTNFIGGTTVTFDGTLLTISASSTTVIETSIPASLLATFGTSTVEVTNPGPGGGTATSPFIISRGAVKFAFSGAPYSGTVDGPITATIQAQRENGTVVTNYQSDITLNASDSATPESILVNIVNGAGTTTISDTVAETVTLSLTDTQGTGLDVSATTSATFAHGVITQLALAGPATLNVGDRAGFVTTRKDQYGNPVTSGPDTTVYFYTTSTSSSAVFYNAATNGTVITSAIIGSGASTTAAWYYDEEPGTYTITSSDNGTAPDGNAGINDATSTIAVNAVATRFMIINPTDGTVDAPITVVVQAQDNLGRLITDYQSDVTLIASSTGGQVNATSTLVDIINGSGTTTISNTIAETVFLSLLDSQGTGLNVASSTQDVVFAPGAVAQFSLTHSGDMEQNTRKEFVAGRKDQYGNFVSASTTPAYMYASPTSTAKFYDTDAGGNEITAIAFTPGNATTSFWFYSNTPATTTVTVSDNATAPDGDEGINDASNEILVTPTAVRFEIVDPTDGTVDASITVTVRALDEFGQVVPSFTEDVTLLVTGSAVANPVLVDLEGGIGTTQVSDTVAETVTLSLSDTQSTGLAATSTQDVMFGVGAFAKLNLNNVVNATAGDLVAYTVTRTDQYNNQITSSSITVGISATPTTSPGTFYGSNSTSSSVITSVAIDAGNASAQFWYYNEVAGSYQVTTQTGAVIGYDDIVIDPAAIAKFTINDRTSMNPASRVQYTVVRKDQFN
ncbi:MAG: IPT/TIG domain-containing protein, partial [Candidatus Wolfebacteria bacterium GW2011_GWA1_47_6]